MASKELEMMECNVIFYVKNTKRLAVDFGGFGIMFENAEDPKGKKVLVEYKGTIGKKDFVAKIVEVQ